MSSKDSKKITKNKKNNQGILNFVLIGAKSSGKTIYLSTLWGKGLIRNTHKEEKKYLKNNWDYIGKHGKAEASSGMFKILHFAYTHQKYGRLDFSIDDYDGSFTETISTENSNTQEERKKLMSSVKKSEGIFFFFPHEADPDRLKDFSQEIDTFIQLAQFSSHNKSPIPASIVVTKWDESEYFSNSEEVSRALEYIENNEYLGRTLKLIEQSFKNTTVMPISSFKEHNLLKPIDYSLDKTFEQWHNSAKSFKNEKKYEKLLKYLSIRHNDTKFNEVYEFNKLYGEAQELFLPEAKKAISKKNGYEEKEVYLNEISRLYQTKPELLRQLKEEVQKEKRQTIFKKKRNKTLSLIIFGILVIGLFEYINKMDVEEEYKMIVDKYSKGVAYKSVNNDIQSFLDSYDNVSFFYAFADVPTKREEIISIQNKLKQESVVKIKKDAVEIIENDDMTAVEKRDALKYLQNNASDDQKKDLENKARQQEYQDKTIKWLAIADGCLKTCEGKSGLEAIGDLLKKANSTDEIIVDDKVKKRVNDLQNKKESLLHVVNIDEILEQLGNADTYSDLAEIIARVPDNLQTTKSIKEKIVSSYLSFIGNANSLDNLSGIINQIPNDVLQTNRSIKDKIVFSYLSFIDSASSLDELSNIINKISDSTFSYGSIRDKYISKVYSKNKSDFQTNRGQKLLDDLKNTGDRETFKEKIDKDINNFLNAKRKYHKLIKEINNRERYEDLALIDYSGYDNFEELEKNNILSALNEKMTQSLKIIMDSGNLNKYDPSYLTDTEQKLKKIEEIDSFKIKTGSSEYLYAITEDKKTEIGFIHEAYNSIKRLVENGIYDIEVTIVGYEDNSIEFECSSWGMQGARDDIDITGLSQNLYSENAEKCEGEDVARMTYKTKVSIMAETRYGIQAIDKSILTAKLDDPVSGDIKFLLIDLYNLSEGSTITMTLNDPKIKLEFKKGY